MKFRPFRKIPNGEHSLLCGVCAGIAYAVGLPAWLIRLTFLLTMGPNIVVYIILAILTPGWDKVPEDFDQVAGS